MATLNSSLPKTAEVIPLRAKVTRPKKDTRAKTPKAKKPPVETPLETLKRMVKARDDGGFRIFKVIGMNATGEHAEANLDYCDIPTDPNVKSIRKNVFFIRSPAAPCDRILKKYTGGFYERLYVSAITHDNSIETLSLEHVSEYRKRQ